MNNHEKSLIQNTMCQVLDIRATLPFLTGMKLSLPTTIDTFTKSLLKAIVKKHSLYIHLPFCESMCTFVVATNALQKIMK
jgi:coproporphyrinogen III oxidase-like Fe-S oxidoreductase